MTALRRTYPEDERFVADIGLRHFLRPHVIDGDGKVRAWLWWHDCPAVEHVSWGWIGDKMDGTKSGHGVPALDLAPWPPVGGEFTVEGSLICERCGDHGWIRAGRWVPC